MTLEDFSNRLYESKILHDYKDGKIDYRKVHNWIVSQKEQLTIPDVMQWMAVEDELPKEMEWVLAYDTIGKQVRYMRRIDDLEWQMGMFSIRDVSHWMPIPETPCA